MNLKSENETNEIDEFLINRCIDLSQQSIDMGDAPFGSLIAIKDEIIAEGLNNCKNKVSDHAEIVALHKAHLKLGSSDLSVCTLYTNCEPCPMCSFMIREYKIKRVVFAIPSAVVGGYTKWPILQDKELSKLKPIFAEPPKVVCGLLESKAKLIMEKSGLWMFGSDVKL